MARSPLALTVFILLPLGIATGILASYTIGEALAPRESGLIGVAIALLAVMTAAYLMLFSNITEKPGSHLGAVLIGFGAACILVAVALQFYLGSLSAESARCAAEILAESARNNRPFTNVNVNASIPGSVYGVGYFALFAGIWMVAVGIRIGVASGERAARGPPDVGRPSFAPVRPLETGFREE